MKLFRIQHDVEGRALVDRMHRAGVNVRFLGRIRKIVTDEALKGVLLHEMITRILKNILREKLRILMRKRGALAQEPYKNLVRQFMNNIVLGGKNAESYLFWTKQLKQYICDKFDTMALSEVEMDEKYDFRVHLDFVRLFKRLQELTRIIFGAQVYEILRRKSEKFALSNTDIDKLSVKVRNPHFFFGTFFFSQHLSETKNKKKSQKVKYMNIMDFSEAMALYMEAKTKEQQESDRLFELAHQVPK